MRSRGQKIFIAVIIALILISFIATFISGLFVYASAAATQSTVNSLREKISGITEERKTLQKELDQISSEKKSILNQKGAIEQKAELNQAEIETASELLEQLGKLVHEKEEELRQAEQVENEQYELLKKRIRAMYEYGSVSYLEMLLASESFSEMQSRFEILTQITSHDNEILRKLSDARQEVNETKLSLEQDMKEEQELKKRLEETKSTLAAQIQEIDRRSAELESDEETKLANYLEKEAEEERLQAELKSKIAELAKNTKYVGGTMMWPLPSGYTTITSPFGYRIHPILKVYKLHTGADISAPKGTKIYAANDGEVITSAYSNAWGNYVVINHGGGTATLYAHMSKRLVSKGDSVIKGQNIGLVGMTGYATACHLHFEIQVNGKSVDPFETEFKKS